MGPEFIKKHTAKNLVFTPILKLGYFSIIVIIDVYARIFSMNEPITEIVVNQRNSERIRIMLADDHPLLRQALRNVLEKQSDFDVIAEVSDGEEAVKVALELVPDVIIMDICMPTLNGIEATRQIKVKNPKIIVLVLTVYDDTQHILGILEAGAAGYLTKSVFGEEVIHAIYSVMSRETVLSNHISQQILKYAFRHSFKPVIPDCEEQLTVREMEILKLAAKGMGNKDIALALDLSLATIKGYLVEIFSKLKVGSRTEAVITALRTGLISINDLE